MKKPNKYTPHQGKQELARRVKQMKKADEKTTKTEGKNLAT